MNLDLNDVQAEAPDPRTARHHPERSLPPQSSHCDTEGDPGAATAGARPRRCRGTLRGSMRPPTKGQVASPPRLDET